MNTEAFRGYAGFFGGGVLFAIYDNVIRKLSENKTAIYAGSLCLIFLIIALCKYTRWMLLEQQNFMFQFILFPAVILWFLTSKLSAMLFNHPLWGNLGEASFDIFVWHYVVLIFMRVLADSQAIIFNSDNLPMLFFAGAMTLFGIASHYFIENPVNNWIYSAWEKYLMIWNSGR